MTCWRPSSLARGVVLALALAAGDARAGGLEPEAAPAPRASALDQGVALEVRGLGAVRAVVRETPETTPPGAEVVLLDAEGRAALVLSDLPGTGEWTFWETAGLAAADVDGDGATDLVAVVEYVTGIGPDGARPFPLAAVYLQRPDGFVRDPDREAAANEGALAGAWSDADELAVRLRGGDG